MKTLSVYLCMLSILSFGQAKYKGINVEKTTNSYIVELNLPDIKYTEITDPITNRQFIQLEINDEFGIISEVGKPELPQITFDFEIAIGDEIPQIELISSNQTTKNILHPIYPFQKPISTEQDNYSTEFDYDISYYQTTGTEYDLISLSGPYIIAGKKGIKLTISPINYNPNENKLTITDYLKFEIKSNLNNQVNESLPQAFFNFFSNHFINFEPSAIKNIEYGNYLIITAPQYEQAINYFAVYKSNIV